MRRIYVFPTTSWLRHWGLLVSTPEVGGASANHTCLGVSSAQEMQAESRATWPCLAHEESEETPCKWSRLPKFFGELFSCCVPLRSCLDVVVLASIHICWIDWSAGESNNIQTRKVCDRTILSDRTKLGVDVDRTAEPAHLRDDRRRHAKRTRTAEPEHTWIRSIHIGIRVG